MLAAAATLWLLFALWIASPVLGVARASRRIAAALLVVELLLLAAWHYGTEYCFERTCAPVAQAFGVGARVDLPLIAGLFLAVTMGRLYRAALETASRPALAAGPRPGRMLHGGPPRPPRGRPDCTAQR